MKAFRIELIVIEVKQSNFRRLQEFSHFQMLLLYNSLDLWSYFLDYIVPDMCTVYCAMCIVALLLICALRTVHCVLCMWQCGWYVHCAGPLVSRSDWNPSTWSFGWFFVLMTTSSLKMIYLLFCSSPLLLFCHSSSDQTSRLCPKIELIFLGWSHLQLHNWSAVPQPKIWWQVFKI